MGKLSFEYSKLTIEQVNLVKGFAILLIVVHNFMHNLPPMFGQNEFNFSPLLVENYAQWLSVSPEYILTGFFSVWGHYGVELFIFVSAYGLTLSYKQGSSFSLFLKKQFFKVYIPFVICVAVYISLGLLKQHFVAEQVLYWDSILWKLLLISNFIPGEAISPVGPWWFIPFIFQFYLIFPLIIFAYRKLGTVIFFIVAFLGYIFEASNIWGYINYSPLGHLPLICLGMYLSTKKSVSIPYWLIALAIAAFTMGHFNFYFWLISDLAVTLILFICLKLLFNQQATSLSVKLFAALGGISLHLFLVNGFLRSPFHQIALHFNSWWGDILSALLSLIFSLLFAYSLKWLEGYIRRYSYKMYKFSLK